MPKVAEKVKRKRGRPLGSDPTPRLLKDLRWAYFHKGLKNKGTPNQMALREMYEKEPKAFLGMLRSEERLWRETRIDQHRHEMSTAGPGKEGEEGKGIPDGGSGKAVRAAQRLLERWEEGKKEAE